MENVYLLLGPEKGRKEDFIKNIKNSLGDCDISRFYSFEDYEEEMFAQLNTDDLFGARKLIILDEAQDIKTKDRTKAIVQYIKNPSECATLILLSTELYINSDIMQAIPDKEKGIIKFYELFESQKNAWLKDFFKRNGFNITQDACENIIEKVENNLSEFENVCSQIVIFLKGIQDKDTITDDDVEEYMTHSRQESEYTLFAYIAKGKLESALECLQTLVNYSDTAHTISILSPRLAGYFRRVYSLHMCMQQGMTIDNAFSSTFFDTDKKITMPKDKEIYKAAVARYSVSDIERILAALADCDIQARSEGPALQSAILEKYIADIILRKGRKLRHPSFASL